MKSSQTTALIDAILYLLRNAQIHTGDPHPDAAQHIAAVTQFVHDAAAPADDEQTEAKPRTKR